MLTSLAYVLLLGMALGAMASRLRLPSLVGMLLAGILLGPCVLNLLSPSLLGISADLRQLALVIILTRAGLSLELEDLRRAGRPAVLLCFVPASPRRGARCACRRMWRRPYSPWPWRTPAPASPPRPWPGRGGAFTPATLAGPGRATWAWVSPLPARPPAATAGRWSCPTPAGGPGRPSPCPSEESGAENRAAFLYFCPFRAIIEGEPIPTL